VISFEELAGLTPAEPGGRTRVAILNAISGRLAGGFFGVLTEGFPQLVRVNREVVQPAARQAWPENGPVICQIRMINEYPLIPDLEVIEDLIEEALGPREEVLS
jgi:chemosensory pili system protein ChpC